MEGCGDPVGYLAMGPQPSVVSKGGLSEESRPGSRRQNKAEEEKENTRPGSRKKKKKQILPIWMLQTSSNVMDNGSSESCVNPDPVQPSAVQGSQGSDQDQDQEYSHN